ncbi:hypothetical protein ACFWP3_39850 [Streptomyces sp. NPDC058525]|uniref:hypothetical protein n=1 Tax=Streptomyces sp. NPDC058525 TaxID=3346538 RepID=UPI00365B6389
MAVGTGLSMKLEGLSVSEQTVMRRMTYLDFLAVRAGRGEGLGSRLAETFLDWYRAKGCRVALAGIAPGCPPLISLLLPALGLAVGAPAADLGVQIGSDPVVINEKPVCTAWLPLVPEVCPSLAVVPGILVVTGIFD